MTWANLRKENRKDTLHFKYERELHCIIFGMKRLPLPVEGEGVGEKSRQDLKSSDFLLGRRWWCAGDTTGISGLGLDCVFTLTHGGQLAGDTARGTLQMRLSLIQVQFHVSRQGYIGV